MAWILDTNVLSELRKPRPEPKVTTFITRCPLTELFVSAVTFSEIRFGIERVPESRRTQLTEWLTLIVRPCLLDGSFKLPRTLCFAGGFFSKMGAK